MSQLGSVLNRRDERQFAVIGEAWKRLSMVCQLAPQITFSSEIKRSCEQEWIGFRDCLEHGEIFIAADIFEALDDLKMDLRIVFSAPPGKGSELIGFTRQLDAAVDEVKVKKLRLAKTVRSRFGFAEVETAVESGLTGAGQVGRPG